MKRCECALRINKKNARNVKNAYDSRGVATIEYSVLFGKLVLCVVPLTAKPGKLRISTKHIVVECESEIVQHNNIMFNRVPCTVHEVNSKMNQYLETHSVFIEMIFTKR